MKWGLVLVICLQMVLVLSAPMQFPLQLPLLQPQPGTLQQQQLAVQEQIFAMQRFQALQSLDVLRNVLSPNHNFPILLIFPKIDKNTNIEEKLKGVNHPKDDIDSIVIDADNSVKDDINKNKYKGVLLVPQTRGILGSIISGIPFLPIEVNVPDAYQWFADLIAGLGSQFSQFPFYPGGFLGENSGEEEEFDPSLKDSKKKQVKSKPIMLVPFSNPYLI